MRLVKSFLPEVEVPGVKRGTLVRPSRIVVLLAVVAASSLPLVRAGNATAASVGTSMTVTRAPWISRVWHGFGPTSGGDRVRLTGHHFTGTTAVRFGGVPGTDLTVVNDTRILVTTPAHVAGRVRVRVIAPGRSSIPGRTYIFDAPVTPPLITITSITPDFHGPFDGNSVTITGVGFTGAVAVKFGGVAGTALFVLSDTTLTVMPPQRAPGEVRVKVVRPDGSSPSSVADRFTYPGPETITAISPSSGPAGGGTTVTITGTGFTPDTTVNFGSTGGVSATIDSDTQITAIAPRHPLGGVVHIGVVGGFGNSVASAADQFTYLRPPTIIQVLPSVGPSAGGTTVTITGTGFTTATSVDLNGSVPFTVLSDTTIVVVTPPGSPGTVDVVVSSPGGPSDRTQHFSYF